MTSYTDRISIDSQLGKMTVRSYKKFGKRPLIIDKEYAYMSKTVFDSMNIGPDRIYDAGDYLYIETVQAYKIQDASGNWLFKYNVHGTHRKQFRFLVVVTIAEKFKTKKIFDVFIHHNNAEASYNAIRAYKLNLITREELESLMTMLDPELADRQTLTLGKSIVENLKAQIYNHKHKASK